MVRKPTNARKIPRISSLRSFEILFHCHADFEEDRRELLDLVFDLELDSVLDREVLFGDRDEVLTELDDRDPDLLLPEMGFCAKRTPNRIITYMGVFGGKKPPKTNANPFLSK
ncbi:MAG: hypothetical protein Q7U53_19590 [Anaerolineaceae bacterium]|nr:hypothetical protein [Anaerolineaceae bacterium]